MLPRHLKRSTHPQRGPSSLLEVCATVGLFLGCVADAMFRHVHHATARVLQQNGCDVIIPASQQCCGAIHYHSGASGPAVDLMKKNITAFSGLELDAVVVNVAGCGAMLKDYSHILSELEPGSDHAAADNVVRKMKDIREFLAELGILPPEGRLNLTVAYQDACHLQHAQQIREQPRSLLNAIPGVKLVPVAEPPGATTSLNRTWLTDSENAASNICWRQHPTCWPVETWVVPFNFRRS